MSITQTLFLKVIILLWLMMPTTNSIMAVESYDSFLQPLISKYCVECHGQKKTKGKVNLYEIKTEQQLLANPKLMKQVYDAVEVSDMPPEDEPQLDAKARVELLSYLKVLLRKSSTENVTEHVHVNRLNRFQYNNAIRDLFQLKFDIFPLPEKLMTRQVNYLAQASDKMPDKVQAFSDSLSSQGGLAGVEAFPKDLRAEHGFDNQSDQLNLSPLLFDSFLKLSVSIVESPDFNDKSVGIWRDFFSEPQAGTDTKVEMERRLRPFLELAFRGTVDDEIFNRYLDFALGKLAQGTPFTDSMKKVASAILSSPMFLFRAENATNDQFKLASRLSFFLWGTTPDQELLALAKSGDLSKPEVLNKTITRMMASPKIERFLDSFPSQWMRLENILAAVPDPKQYPLFHLDETYPVSLQMVLEPLLLFDAVFIEDRPIIDLIAPTFSYQSDFLKTWYTSDLKIPVFDDAQAIALNKEIEMQRVKIDETIKVASAELSALVDPVMEKLLKERRQQGENANVPTLKPYASWEFDNNLKDSVSGLELTAHGKINYQNGMVVLNKAFLQSKPLSIELKAKTMAVWCKVKNTKQRGGGAMTLEGPIGQFDSIVLGERKQGHWISGSDNFNRTDDFSDSPSESGGDQLLQLVMVYAEDGTITMYRNGELYGKPYKKGLATFPKDQTSVLFGLRHLPGGGNKHLSMTLDRAQLFNRALTTKEVGALAQGENYIAEEELVKVLSKVQQEKRLALLTTLDQSEQALKALPMPMDLKKQKQEAKNKYEGDMRRAVRTRTFERIAVSDPRYGGVITNAATMTMNSSPQRTLPIARGAWIIEVILNDPPPPPPNNVPPLNEDSGPKNLTIREKFAKHRENPDCAGCHARLDPLGFALENYDITGRWREKYENGREVDASGTLMRKYEFDGAVTFKQSLVAEKKRFAKAFTSHLLRFALSRELSPADSFTVEEIVEHTEKDDYRLKAIIRDIIHSDSFQK